MKRSNLIAGILYLLVGVGCLLVGLLTDSNLDGLLFGFAGAGLCSGLLVIWQYIYWTSPRNRERKKEVADNKEIEAHDELKEKIRDKAGRYTYVLGLIIITISMVVFAVLGALEIVDNMKMIIIYLGCYLALQIVAGILIFNHMIKKY